MNMLTDTYKAAKKVQISARSELLKPRPRYYEEIDELAIQKEASRLFPLLETCRRVGEIYTQKSAIYQQTNDATLHAVDTGGLAPAWDTIVTILQNSEKPL